jgi:hypothetical protein
MNIWFIGIQVFDTCEGPTTISYDNLPLPLNLNVGGFLGSEMDTLTSTSQAPRKQDATESSGNRITIEYVPIEVFIIQEWHVAQT